MKLRFSSVITPTVWILGSVFLVAASLFSGGAPAFRTGAPGDLTCADSGCHVTHPLNSGDGAVVIEGPATFQGGTPVDMIVRASKTGATRFGFQITLRDANDQMIGTWEVTDGTALAEFGSAPAYLTHAAFAPRATDTYAWAIRWNPPAGNSSDVTLYAAANAANGDDTQFNDFIYTTTLNMAFAGSNSVEAGELPSRLGLVSAYPNPTKGGFALDVDLSFPSNVSVHVYDPLGREVHRIDKGLVPAGTQRIDVTDRHLAPGTYRYRVVASGHSRTGSILVLR